MGWSKPQKSGNGAGSKFMENHKNTQVYRKREHSQKLYNYEYTFYVNGNHYYKIKSNPDKYKNIDIHIH